MLSDHRLIDFVMRVDLTATAPFQNPQKADMAKYKIELNGRVKIPGRPTKTIAGIKKIFEMTINMKFLKRYTHSIRQKRVKHYEFGKTKPDKDNGTPQLRFKL